MGKRHVGHTVTNVGLSADGRRIVAGTRNCGIFIFDGDSVLHNAQARKIVRDIAISADGRLAVAGSEDGILYGFQLPMPLETADSQTAELFQTISDRFSLEEFRTLCFHLGIIYDDLGGEGRIAKIRELVLHMHYTDQLNRLQDTIQKIRSDLNSL